MIQADQKKERFLLIGVSEHDGDDTEESLAELEELVETAGAESAGMLIQKRERIHPATYVGKGKVEEIRELIFEKEADGIVCDDELSPAQLKYRASRLTGMGRAMSRLGGGIGARGPGEKKLEVDRRLIGSRISQLKRELAEARSHREVTRGRRVKKQIPVAAVVGYTNAGKSTLLNALTDAEVLEEDMLFATLDPTTRVLELAGKQQILLTDTVGFIRKLPHHLVEAFKSTLEEAKYADYILHVVDSSNPAAERQMHIVYETLQNLGVKKKKIVTLFNKRDKRADTEPLHDFQADYTLSISAKYGEGLEAVKETLSEILREEKILVERLIPYPDAGILQIVRKQGELLEESYEADGIFIRAYVPMEVYGKMN